jgi:polyketide synthase PksN
MHNRWQVTPLADGKVESFPAAGLLEIAAIAGTLAGERRVLRITDVVWAHPVSFRRGAQDLWIVLVPVNGHVEYAISSLDEENETVV